MFGLDRKSPLLASVMSLGKPEIAMHFLIGFAGHTSDLCHRAVDLILYRRARVEDLA
jgi:hypothetical protein